MATPEPKIPLPKGWSNHVQLAVLHVVALARTAITAVRGSVAQTGSSLERLRAELDAALEENALLREELRLKDLRMSRVRSRRRPHFRPVERLAILALRAARGWSKREKNIHQSSPTMPRFVQRRPSLDSARWIRS